MTLIRTWPRGASLLMLSSSMIDQLVLHFRRELAPLVVYLN
jgi:hypothetical protein